MEKFEKARQGVAGTTAALVMMAVKAQIVPRRQTSEVNQGKVNKKKNEWINGLVRNALTISMFYGRRFEIAGLQLINSNEQRRQNSGSIIVHRLIGIACKLITHVPKTMGYPIYFVTIIILLHFQHAISGRQ